MVFCSNTPCTIIRNPEYGKVTSEQFKEKFPFYDCLAGFSSGANDIRLNNREKAENILDTVWRQTTNIAPIESKLGILIPIHNEEKNLPQLLEAIRHSILPQEVTCEIFFILNGSTDSSEKIIRNFISTNNADFGVKFFKVDTNAKSKAEALNEGYRIAKAHNHNFFIAIDADTLVMPETFMMFYKQYANTVQNKSAQRPLILSGICISRRSNLQKWIRKYFFSDAMPKKENRVAGQIHAWNAALMEKLGGYPNFIQDDLAIKVVSQSHGINIARFSDVISIGESPKKLEDWLRYFYRWVKGVEQLKKTLESKTGLNILQREIPLVAENSFTRRLVCHLRQIKNNKVKIITFLPKVLLYESFIAISKFQLKRERYSNNSWTRVR